MSHSHPFDSHAQAGGPVEPAGQTEWFFRCPHCWQRVSALLDVSAGSQQYVEDCEVCCRPVAIRYTVEADAIVQFEALDVR